MSHFKDIFKTPENQNWAKCWIASEITRMGLLEICESELKSFHTQLTLNLPPNSPTCTQCKIRNIIPYSRSHGCRQGQCRCAWKKCCLGICDELGQKIQKVHKFGEISWKNTNMEEWPHNEWEVAKCYFPMTGYLGKKTPGETDFNGIISLIINNTLFDNCFSTQNLQLCDQVRFIKYYHLNLVN